MYQFAVFGNPITHSLSPIIHQQFATELGLAISYQKHLVPLDQFHHHASHFMTSGGHGANVTLPFKKTAYAYADQLTNRAIAAKAVNTLIFKDGTCIGDNTDGIGLIRDLTQKSIDIYRKRILIVGAGGAAHGIIPAILQANPSNLAIVNRTRSKAVELANAMNCAVYSALDKPFDLIINATNADFQNETWLPADLDLQNTACYDLNYGDRHQTFKHWAEKSHAHSCHDGLGMLIEQAAESFYLWTGLRPKTALKINLAT